MNLVTFSDFISENLDIVNDKLVFNSKSPSSVQTSFGKGQRLNPFQKKVPGTDMVSYSLYQSKGATSILKALKNADHVNDSEVRQFINRSAVYATRILRGKDIDIIVSPISSSSLVKEFARKIQERTYYDFYIDSFQKTADLSKIKIDRDHPSITDDIISSMEKTLKRAQRRGSISVKQFAPPHRKFLKNLFEVVNEKLLNKVMNKNVVIIDDVMTTGSTSKQIYDQLKIHGANEVITLTMFKATS